MQKREWPISTDRKLFGGQLGIEQFCWIITEKSGNVWYSIRALRPRALQSLLSFMHLYFCYLHILVKCNDKNCLCLQNNSKQLCAKLCYILYTGKCTSGFDHAVALCRYVKCWIMSPQKKCRKNSFAFMFHIFCSLFLWLLHKWAKWSNLLSLRGRVESAARQASVNGWQDRVSQTSLARKTDSYLSFQQNYVLNFFLHPPVNEFWFLH